MSGFRFFKGSGPKKSVLSRTAEREFDREVKKLEQLDENSKKIYKDMKRCTESQAAQCKHEVKMAQDLLSSALCKEDEDLRQSMENWNQSSQKLETLMQELNASCQKTVSEPMKKFGSVFPSVQQAVNKRKQALQEYSKRQEKVDKYQERDRTGANVVKLEGHKKSLSTAKKDFDSQNDALMEDMPKLYEGRIDYFQPSFQALIKSQVKYYTDTYNVYSDLSKTINGEKDDMSEEDSNQWMQQKLAEIRALSITVDD